MSKKKLAIVIVSYNTKKLLQQTLSSLEKQVSDKDEVEIVIVDNNSKDGTKEYLEKIKKNNKYVVVFSKENLGFAGGNNLGIKEAIKRGADYITTLNSDVLIKDRFWQPMIDFLEKNKDIGAVNPKIYFAPGYEFHQKRYKKTDQGKVIWGMGIAMDWANVIGKNRNVDQVDNGQYEKAEEVDLLTGCCLLAKREIWQKTNGFKEKYFMYYEDSDLSQRIKKLGLKLYCVPQAKIWHLNAGSSQVGGALQDYFISRNRLLFGLKWVPLRSKIALIKESFRLLASGREWQKKGIRDYYLHNFKDHGKGSWTS